MVVKREIESGVSCALKVVVTLEVVELMSSHEYSESGEPGK